MQLSQLSSQRDLKAKVIDQQLSRFLLTLRSAAGRHHCECETVLIRLNIVTNSEEGDVRKMRVQVYLSVANAQKTCEPNCNDVGIHVSDTVQLVLVGPGVIGPLYMYRGGMVKRSFSVVLGQPCWMRRVKLNCTPTSTIEHWDKLELIVGFDAHAVAATM